MKTELTKRAIQTLVDHGYAMEKVWWGQEEAGKPGHLFIKLYHGLNGTSHIAICLAKSAVEYVTELPESHIHIT